MPNTRLSTILVKKKKENSLVVDEGKSGISSVRKKGKIRILKYKYNDFIKHLKQKVVKLRFPLLVLC